MTHTTKGAALDAADPAGMAARHLVGFQLLEDQDRALYEALERFVFLEGLRAWLARRAAATWPPPSFSGQLADLETLSSNALIAELARCADLPYYVAGVLRLQDEAPDLAEAVGRYVPFDELVRHLAHESTRAQNRTLDLLEEAGRRLDASAFLPDVPEAEREHIDLHW